eukprot:TRINITY_DN39382_c0_g1_i1.p1 TRINITY_DN39382_c0_g1~~TRINITY_DN39382_c0_g1_i1.p1  ORF type:complete len:723 (-),score=112.29 TRINITY_DN39382_c0_g1_i1:55-1899(-)
MLEMRQEQRTSPPSHREAWASPTAVTGALDNTWSSGETTLRSVALSSAVVSPEKPKTGQLAPAHGQPHVMPDANDSSSNAGSTDEETLSSGLPRADKLQSSQKRGATVPALNETPAERELTRRRSFHPSEALQHMKMEFEKENWQQSMQERMTRRLESDTSGPFKKFQTKLRYAVASRWFDTAVAILIIATGGIVGWESDHAIKNPNEVPPDSLKQLNRVASFLFLIELIVRVIAEGTFFVSCWNSNVAWNFFDSALVLFSIIEEFLEGYQFTDLLRMVRLLRTVKVLRVIRTVRFFKDLRVMVNGVMSSAKSLLWAAVLLSLVMFVYGVVVMQLLIPLCVGVEPLDPSSVDFHVAADNHHRVTAWIIQYRYGSLAQTVFTLFQCVSGGVDWADAALPLKEFHWSMEYGFALYIFFTVFCCLNIVTGIFVDNAKEIRVADEEAMCIEAQSQRRRWVKEVVQLFKKVASQSSPSLRRQNSLTFQEFEEGLSDIKVQALFNSLGVNVEMTGARELFELFDFDEGGDVDQDEFAAAIQRLNGQARSIDLFKLRRDSRKVAKNLGRKIEAVASICSQLKGHIGQLSQEAAAPPAKLAVPRDVHHALTSVSSMGYDDEV